MLHTRNNFIMAFVCVCNILLLITLLIWGRHIRINLKYVTPFNGPSNCCGFSHFWETLLNLEALTTYIEIYIVILSLYIIEIAFLPYRPVLYEVLTV